MIYEFSVTCVEISKIFKIAHKIIGIFLKLSINIIFEFSTVPWNSNSLGDRVVVLSGSFGSNFVIDQALDWSGGLFSHP